MAIAVYQLIMQKNDFEQVGVIRVYDTNEPFLVSYPRPYKFFSVLQIRYNHAFLHGGKDISIKPSDMSAMRLEAGRLFCNTLSWTHKGRLKTVSSIRPFPFESSPFVVEDLLPDEFIQTLRSSSLTFSQMKDMSNAST
jgi:hypothetical protein